MVHRLLARARLGLALAVVAAATLVGLARPQRVAQVSPPVPAELPDTLGFDLVFGGLGSERVDLVWRGRAGAPVPAQVTLRLEYAGQPAERGMPVWPVNAWLFYSGDDLRTSFAAELSGSMNWRSGEMRITGIVSDGVRIGMPVEQRMRVMRPGFAARAELVFLARIAAVEHRAAAAAEGVD